MNEADVTSSVKPRLTLPPVAEVRRVLQQADGGVHLARVSSLQRPDLVGRAVRAGVVNDDNFGDRTAGVMHQAIEHRRQGLGRVVGRKDHRHCVVLRDAHGHVKRSTPPRRVPPEPRRQNVPPGRFHRSQLAWLRRSRSAPRPGRERPAGRGDQPHEGAVARGDRDHPAPRRCGGPAVATMKRSAAARKTMRISSSAKLAPIQRRRPPPNGIQVKVPGLVSRKRSGRNACGLGIDRGIVMDGRGPGDQHDAWRIVQPPIVPACLTSRGSAFGSTGRRRRPR